MKKDEYRTIASVDTIVFVDPEAVTTSRRHGDDWTDTPFLPADTVLPSLGFTFPHAEMFARD